MKIRQKNELDQQFRKQINLPRKSASETRGPFWSRVLNGQEIRSWVDVNCFFQCVSFFLCWTPHVRVTVGKKNSSGPNMNTFWLAQMFFFRTQERSIVHLDVEVICSYLSVVNLLVEVREAKKNSEVNQSRSWISPKRGDAIGTCEEPRKPNQVWEDLYKNEHWRNVQFCHLLSMGIGKLCIVEV